MDEKLYDILRDFGIFYLNAEVEGDVDNYIQEAIREIRQVLSDEENK
jgi:hypothetical protein